nr:MAG TPA: hypothetical protein [Crassvirales sp.]
MNCVRMWKSMRRTITSPLLILSQQHFLHYYNQNSTANHIFHLFRSLLHNELKH